MSTTQPQLVYRPPGRLSVEDRAAIARAYRNGHRPADIARAIGRDHTTIVHVLRQAGLHTPKGKKHVSKPMTFFPQYNARDTSTITLVGITDPARIEWYRRTFGAERIHIAPPASGKVYAEVHHG